MTTPRATPTPKTRKLQKLHGNFTEMRNELFTRLPLKAYRAARKRHAMSRSNWWWYLDELGDELAAQAKATAEPARGG